MARRGAGSAEGTGRAHAPLGRGAAALLVGLVATLGAPAPARAYEAEVDTSVAQQWYSLSSPFGDPTLRRRRTTALLGLRVADLDADADPRAPQLSFVARLRLDADFGQAAAERNPELPTTYVPGLAEAPVDLMVAYLEGRGYLGGVGGFRLGRQYVVDPLGWWSFDGALVRLTTPAYLEAEGYAGFEQRASLPLSTDRFQADGVWRGDRSELEIGEHPSLLSEERLAPAWGASLGSVGSQWVQARASYRKVWNRDVVYVSPFPDLGGGFQRVGGTRVSSERAGGSLTLSHPDAGALEGTYVHALHVGRIAEWAVRADAFVTERVGLGAAWEYSFPVFDGDAIWNWFSHRGMNTGTLRATVQPLRRLELAGSGGLRWYSTAGDPQTYAAEPDRTPHARTDALGTLDVRYRLAEGSVSVRGLAEAGQRGRRAGGDATLRQSWDAGTWDTLVIASLFDLADGLRPTRDATSVGYVLGGGFRPLSRTRLGVEWEHSQNRLVGHRFRALATLDLVVPP